MTKSPTATAAAPAADPRSRREFLRLLGAGFLATYTVVPLASSARGQSASPLPPFLIVGPDSDNTMFPQSVASGDPTPSGVILWSRVAPGMILANEPLGVEVALDNSFSQTVLRVRVPASQLTATLDYTLRVDVDRRLQPNTIYFYRFIYRGIVSRVGRARTLPTADAALASLKLAVVNCQDYTNGYYPAYNYLADDPTVDFVVHLGDFIYETTGGTSFQDAPFPDRQIQLPSSPTGNIARDLGDYRLLYRTYRTDPFLRRALENFTWMTIWDDHEMANDQFHDTANNSQGAPDHPFAADPNALRQLKLDSQQAWFEYNAARVRLNPAATDIFQKLSIYRKFRFGTLAELVLTDERTYRSPHPNGEFVGSTPSGFGARYFAPDTPQSEAVQNDPTHVMLGDTQRDFLTSSLLGSTALWKAWGNEVFLARIRSTVTPSVQVINGVPVTVIVPLPAGVTVAVDNDAWDGYRRERGVIAQTLKNGGISNLVVLTGDLHSYLASYFKVNYDLASNDAANPAAAANLVGVEFMSPGITSSNLKEQFGFDDATEQGLETLVTTVNPHVTYFQSSTWGYATVEFTRQFAEFTMYVVDKSQNIATSPRSVLKRFRTPVNVVRIDDVTPAAPAAPTLAQPGLRGRGTQRVAPAAVSNSAVAGP